MADHLTVSTATETREQAVTLAQSAVQTRLAAGAQIIGPVVSVFWHHGECGTGEEFQLLLTTSTTRYPQLEALLVEQHPWTNPEIRATPIVLGAATYLDWIDRSTTD